MGLFRFFKNLFYTRPKMFFRDCTNVRLVLFWICYLRYIWYVRIRGKIKLLEGQSGVATNTVQHNLRSVRLTLTCDRSLALIRPLAVLETLGPKTDTKILCIGPRAEGELIRLWTHGYAMKNIRGLDLISYSPYIDVGDMHAMAYADNAFDVVLCGWTIAYSDDKKKAAAEMVRVTRPGGVISVGVHYTELTNEEIIAKLGYLPGSANRLLSTQMILDCFGDAVDHVYFNHGIVKGVNSASGNLLIMFSIKK